MTNTGTGADQPGLYFVDSRFVDPTQEQAWSQWYNEHLGNLLAHVPGFLHSQRFRAPDAGDPCYLGLHALSRLAALSSAEYTSRGGRFPEKWRPAIHDWYRGFYIGATDYPEVARNEILLLTDCATETMCDLDLPFIWLTAAGLSPRAPQRGLATTDRDRGFALARQHPKRLRAFAPITGRMRKPAA
jgi:hypothetical protein